MNTERELKKGSTQTLILAVLSSGSLHGYAITREIKQRNAGALEVGEGSLYPMLRAMEREEVVTSSWELQPSGAARRVYEITDKGRKALAASEAYARRFSTAVDAVLGNVQPEPGGVA